MLRLCVVFTRFTHTTFHSLAAVEWVVGGVCALVGVPVPAAGLVPGVGLLHTLMLSVDVLTRPDVGRRGVADTVGAAKAGRTQVVAAAAVLTVGLQVL